MNDFLVTVVWVAAYLLAVTGMLHLLPRLGSSGRAVTGWLSRAPGLDLLIVAYQIVPVAGGAVFAGWTGLAGAVVGAIATYFIWVTAHEYRHRETIRNGPRIVTTLNRIVGSNVRQQVALWTTTIALPAFWAIRAAQLIVYPVLVWGIHLPPYKSSEWVMVSRHKFDGLVGHDRLWCLYCDWMTGVYALGAEMLRNLESFWCPIRFQSGKKCENCKLDFPDLVAGWVPHDGTMADVVETLERAYEGPEPNRWFGHPDRKLATEDQASQRATAAE